MDDNKVLNINSESVENSLDSIDKAKSLIQTSIDDIDYAKRHLDIEIDKGSYALIRENLKSIYEDLNVCLNNNVSIKIQCENFIHDTDTTEGQVVSITDQSDLDRINALTDDPSFDSNASFDSRAVAEACVCPYDSRRQYGRRVSVR